MYTRTDISWIDEEGDAVLSVTPAAGSTDIPQRAYDTASAQYARIYGWPALHNRLSGGGLTMAEVCALLLDRCETNF